MGKKTQQARLHSRNPWPKASAPAPAQPPARPRKAQKPKLPQELVDLVVDCLWDNPEALKSCSLVARSFLLQTRKYLFAKFDVKLPYLRNSALKELFTKSPYLANYIKDLVVVLVGPAQNIGSSSANDDDDEDPLSSVLASLWRITKLTIKAYGAIPRDFQLDVTPHSRTEFSSLLQRNRVATVSLHSVLNFDTIFLARCFSLRHLELLGTSTLNRFILPSYNQIQPPRLSSLTLGTCDEPFKSLLACCHKVPLPAFNLNDISTLNVDDLMTMWSLTILPRLRSTLKDLVIRIRTYPSNGILVPELINLSELSVLSSLELQCPDDSTEIVFTFRAMRILGSISQPTKLHKLTFQYAPDPGRWPIASPFNEAYWGCVDNIVFNLKLPQSSVVHFKYGPTVLVSNPLHLFPRVRSQGVQVRVSAVPI